MASGLDDTRKEIYIMENFTLEEVKILLSSFKKHGLDLLTDRIQRHIVVLIFLLSSRQIRVLKNTPMIRLKRCNKICE